jgi:hypothetical protein
MVVEIPMRVTANSMRFTPAGNLNDLKSLFRPPGIEPDGAIHVNEEFNRSVMAAAVDWLDKNPKQGYTLLRLLTPPEQ